MIVLGLKSAGIGNCMFQYAAARALSVKTSSVIKFDISGLKEQQKPFRKYTDDDVKQLLDESLGAFDIDCLVAKDDIIKTLRGWGDERLFLNKIKKKIRRLFGVYPQAYFQEKVRFGYDLSLFRMENKSYIDGFFINPKYFKDIKDILREEFTFKNSQSGENMALSKELASCNSVSVHVRRGDYADPKQTGNLYPVYGREYYEKAVNVIQRCVAEPKFYIFSDDADWVIKNFDFIPNSTIVSHNPIDKGYEDLRLMSQCKHNIIANSTFSWWGAWLNNNPEKKVITPKVWRNDSLDTSDLLEDEWIVLP